MFSNWRSSPTHFFRLDDLAFWLQDHGFDTNDVAEVQIVIGQNRVDEGFGAQAIVTFYLKNEQGARFLAGDDAAKGYATINLRSLPPLREIT